MDNLFSDAIKSFYSEEQYIKIISARIAVAGAGGIGSNCAHALIRCGFEKMLIADFDTVSAKNLNRQMFFHDQIGKPKVDCLKKNLLRINPRAQIQASCTRIERDNIHELFDKYDIIIEAFDNPECKSMLVEEFMGSGKLIVSVSGIGGFGDAEKIVTRKIHPDFYIVGDGISEVNDSVKPYAPMVLTAAAKQADIVLSWVLGKPVSIRENSRNDIC
ncbi:MAG: sulfur carrier protein ThiS adenylyltransferase ThiF [Fibrobacter sp.]|nr:sulfur carrier protein ThiS adenylyltransferase ThiF [Fibrobacter sp.]